MPQVQKVTYTMTKNCGNYEKEEVTLEAVIDEGEDVMGSIGAVKLACHQALQMTITAKPSEESKDEPTQKKTTKKKATGTKKTTKKKAPAKAKVEEPAPVEEETVEEPAETEEKTYELSDVKPMLAQVWKKKGESIAKDILKDFGVSHSNDLKAEDYAAVVKECERCLK
jgi:hypothetical protein